MIGPDQTQLVVSLARDQKKLYDAGETIAKARQALADAEGRAKAAEEAKAKADKERAKADKEAGKPKEEKAKKTDKSSVDEVKRAQEELDEAIDAMKRLCVELRQNYQDDTSAIDVILFGRMLACKLPDVTKKGKIEMVAKKIQDEPVMQVAHAISVNRMDPVIDPFTAVDDLHDQHGAENSAATNMLGHTASVSSNLFYRYMNLNVTKLAARIHDKDLLRTALESIMKAAMHAVPKGKQNSTAGHTHPSLVFFTLRRGSRASLVNAFERAVSPGECASMTEEAASKLDREWESTIRLYGRDDLGVILSRVWSSAWKTPEEAKKTIPNLASSVTADFPAIVRDIVDMIAPREHKNGNVEPVSVASTSMARS